MRKNERTLTDTRLEMEVIRLEDYRPSRSKIAKTKLEDQLDMVE